jgi:hypothetical protein
MEAHGHSIPWSLEFSLPTRSSNNWATSRGKSDSDMEQTFPFTSLLGLRGEYGASM